MKGNIVKKGVTQLEEVAGKASADTIRLWESYRDQALLWRALMLIQLPITAVAIVLALVVAYTSDPIINVVPDPLPGRYSSTQLPDKLFISTATEIVNLISSFQPAIARRQFLEAEKSLWEPALSRFKDEVIEKELRAIEETSRSQLFFVNSERIKLERFPEQEKVVVRLPGTLQKIIGTQSLAAESVIYVITMTTIPRQTQNEHGIVIVNIDARNINLNETE